MPHLRAVARPPGISRSRPCEDEGLYLLKAPEQALPLGWGTQAPPIGPKPQFPRGRSPLSPRFPWADPPLRSKGPSPANQGPSRQAER